ncbi:MAG TPA: hypothetical protein VF361_08400 [Candidatus Limnocylindrales bacterium]
MSTPTDGPARHRLIWNGLGRRARSAAMLAAVVAIVAVGLALTVVIPRTTGIGASPTTAPMTRAPASPGSVGRSPTPTPPAATSAAATQTLPGPSPLATASPTPSTLPGATWVPGPQPSLALAAPGAPALPAGTGLDYPTDQCNPVDQNEGCAWLRVAWQEANPSGVTIRIYAVTACLHTPTASSPSAKCVVDGDTIPKAALLLLGTAPASAGSFSFVLAEGETAALGWLPGGGPNVEAVVLQAVNTHGGSPFAIVASSGSCYGCTL